MGAGPLASAPHPSGPLAPGGVRGTLTVFRLAALFTTLAVAMGALVCATRSGAACPTWPGCFPGRLAPEWELNPMVEFTHRVVAIGAGPLVLAAAVLSLRLTGVSHLVQLLPWVALAGAVAAGAFGRLVVLSGLPTWLAAVDLFSALTAMTVMAAACALLGTGHLLGDHHPLDPHAAEVHPVPGDLAVRVRADRSAQVTRLAATGVVVIVAMHVAGIFTAGSGSFTRCLGWPMWRVLDGDRRVWLQDVRIGLATVAVVLVVAAVLAAVGLSRLRGLGVLVGVLLVAELALGVQVGTPGHGTAVASAYVLVAVALLDALALLGALAATTRAHGPLPAGLPVEESAPARP